MFPSHDRDERVVIPPPRAKNENTFKVKIEFGGYIQGDEDERMFVPSISENVELTHAHFKTMPKHTQAILEREIKFKLRDVIKNAERRSE